MPIQDITSPINFLGAYVTRLGATLGLNSSPTTVDMTLVVGDRTSDTRATGFLQTLAIPGGISGLSWGSFKFTGLIQSWERDYSAGGDVYNVKLTDPRVLFNTVNIILDGNNPSNKLVPNTLNAYEYYGSPAGADSTANGMTFVKIRDFLTTNSGSINAYGREFKLVFGSGYYSASGIPDWYRIGSSETTLDSLLQQVADDFGLDYYAYVNHDTYDPAAGAVNTIMIQDINRTASTGSVVIDEFIALSQSTGINISYTRGQELRSDATNAVVLGAPYCYWHCPSTAGGFNAYPAWGRANEGSVIWGAYDPLVWNGSSFVSDASADHTWGYVLLDHIKGRYSDVLDNYKVEHEIISIQYSGGAGVYPKSMSRVFSSEQKRGYRPKPIVLRAALHSKLAWESMLFKHHPNFANLIGIVRQRFTDSTAFTSDITTPEHVRMAAELSIIGVGITDRDPALEALIDAVYNATKEVAETHYGKTFIVNLPLSTLLQEGTFSRAETFPRIEYTVADAAWSQVGIYPPTGVGDYSLVHSTHNANFKDDLGRIKPFCSFASYENHPSLNGPIDLSVLERGNCLVDTVSNRLLIPISVEQYEKDPDRAVVTLNETLQAKPVGSGIHGQINNYYLFLKEMGYTDPMIRQYNLLLKFQDNADYGLVPPRFSTIDITAGTVGINIPLEDTFRTYGPYVLNSSRPGGCKVIRDESLAPWTYGNYANMHSAGRTIASGALSPSTILDLATITNAGLPEFNLGAYIGNNANITAMSLSLDPSNGLTTTYSIQTFSGPFNRVNKMLNDKITKVYTDVTNLQNSLTLDSVDNRDQLITRPKDAKAVGYNNWEQDAVDYFYARIGG